MLWPETTVVYGPRITHSTGRDRRMRSYKQRLRFVYNPCMSGRTGATIQSGSDQGRWLPIHHRSAISLMKSYLHFICTVNIRIGYHHPKVSRRETVYKHNLDFSRQSSLYFGRSSECGAITGRNTGHRAGRSIMIAVTDQSRRAHNPECWCNSR